MNARERYAWIPCWYRSCKGQMMSLSRAMFYILRAQGSSQQLYTQRELCEITHMSLGSVNTAYAQAKRDGYLVDGRLSEKGRAALKPYQVHNAIIMAAGLSSRFAPISYERPKGVLKVKGEVLIERQIKQLLEKGISDITVVVGYKKECFFYLAQKYGVDIIVNPDYATRNNNSTLWHVKDRLSNTFICSSDNYFVINPFERYVYRAYYATQHVDGDTNEWCVTTGAQGRITKVTIGGHNSDIMLGHVYFDTAFSKKFVDILQAEYPKPETADKLWEDIYVDHLKELSMVSKLYSSDDIKEFDSLEDLRSFDPHFLENVDSEVFDNICKTLSCSKQDIGGFYPLKQGLTNLSCHFTVCGKEYVYRHPGAGTDKMIDRTSERAALLKARELGLDATFIYEDEQKGWKISRFIPNARTLDPTDDAQLKRAMQMCRTLHDSSAQLARHFDFFDEGLHYEQLLKEHGPIDIYGYDELKEKVTLLKSYTEADGYPLCISHNDFYMLNLLLDEHDTMTLIDWEYAGMSDIANDFGTFCVCCSLDEERANRCIDYYFGRKASDKERRHFWAYVIFAGWCWYIWSLEKEAEGENVDVWLYIYYRYASEYIDKILTWYESGIAPTWKN